MESKGSNLVEKKCRLSVCIPTYNGEKYVRRQLETILSQLGPDDEVVVSDDSSTDSTLDIIKSLHDERIRISIGNKFHSAIFNLENALKLSHGKYIFLADQDDVWKDGRVDRVLPLLGEYDLVVTDCQVVDADENELHPSLFQMIGSGRGFWKNLCKNSYVGCCMAFSRELMQATLPFPKDIPMHDMWIGMKADAEGFNVLFLNERLVAYRRHEGNVSSSSGRSRRPLWRKLLDRWVMLRLLKFNF